MTPYHFGFLIGPRINAGGRIGDAALGSRLLTLDDSSQADVIAEKLDELNRERQAMEAVMLAEAEAEALYEYGDGSGAGVIVTARENWHRHRWPACLTPQGSFPPPGLCHRFRSLWQGYRLRPLDQWF